MAGKHWALLPMGAGLAQGYCGVALFLAQIGALTHTERYTTLAREAVSPLPALLSVLAAEPELSAVAGPGALNGLGGIVYALVRLSDLLGPGVADCLPDALTALRHATESLPEGPGHIGLADGLAGALAATVLAYRTTGDRAAAELARGLADGLLTAARKGTGNCGFAEGDAGLGWALLRYSASRPGTEAGPHSIAGTALLRCALDTAAHDMGDLSWYCGLPGVVMAAADSLRGVDQPVPHAVVDHCIRLLAAPSRAADLSLGHGTLGSLEALTVLADRGRNGSEEALAHCAGALLAVSKEQGHYCGTPDHVPSPVLLSGLAGIGYALLRLGFPETVPSFLLLDHFPAAARADRAAMPD